MTNPFENFINNMSQPPADPLPSPGDLLAELAALIPPPPTDPAELLDELLETRRANIALRRECHALARANHHYRTLVKTLEYRLSTDGWWAASNSLDMMT